MEQHIDVFDLSSGNADIAAIVVGAGRSGSTMLSNLLREHPAVLSLSEFFRLLNQSALSEDILDAAHFWEIIGAPAPHLRFFLQQQVPMPEFLYPFKDPSSRFTSETGVPPLLLVALPHLTRDYEAVYDELHLVVQGFPPDRLERHFARLFDWLKHRFGRQVCVERSGLSLPIVPMLIHLFPRTKFVHLVRDGRACAWSMSHHFAFRFMVSMAIPVETPASVESVQREDEEGSGEHQQSSGLEQIDFRQILSRPIPLEAFGSFWSRLIITGVQALSVLPEEQVLTIRYEDIVADPQHHLARLTEFIDPTLSDANWLKRASTLIEDRPSGWQQATVRERKALESACQPGQSVLDLIAQEGMHSPKLSALLQRYADTSVAR